MKSTKRRYWLGFDLGGTKMMATVFDKNFNIVAFRRKKTKEGKGAKGVLTRIVETIEEALQAAHLSHKQLGAIGIGTPGWLDLNRGIILTAPNLGLHNIPVKKELTRDFGCSVAVVNDVDAGTYGEYRFGAGRGVRCLLGVFPGTGIGGGLVYEGKLFRGSTSSCMEVGHIHMQPKGQLCGCGRRGCLETVASRLAISSEAGTAAYRGEAPHLLELAGTDVAGIRSGALASSIKAGDHLVEDIVRHAAKELGIAIGSIVNLLAPDMVVLGGGLVEAMPGLYVQQVRQSINKQALRPFTKSLRVVVAKLGDDAVVLGAAALAAEEVGRD
ncbi:MAG TPA: ROK family protein [Verrucomicrobiae bacterium]|nr:ROK family protein [Verrucomicrobiae bacterium]